MLWHQAALIVGGLHTVPNDIISCKCGPLCIILTSKVLCYTRFYKYCALPGTTNKQKTVRRVLFPAKPSPFQTFPIDLANGSFSSFIYKIYIFKTEFCNMSDLTFSKHFCTMQFYQKARIEVKVTFLTSTVSLVWFEGENGRYYLD